MATSAHGPSGNVEDDADNLKLGLIIGIPAAALLVAIIATIVVLLKTGKLKHCCTNRDKKAKDDLARREERKKSIVIIAPTGKRGSELYVARHFYEAEDDNQLSLETGRIVEVQEKLDNGWWRGVTAGKEGWFPATFVKKIDVSDPNCSMHSLSSAVSSTPENVRHPAPPTGKPPDGNMISTDADIYVNSAYEVDQSDGAIQSVDNLADGHPVLDADDNDRKATDLTGEVELEAVDKDIAIKLDEMKSEDIEGYLNEIFSVEDETPEAPRKNKLHLSRQSRDRAYQEGNMKKLKDKQNRNLLKEQSQTADGKINTQKKRGQSKKKSGSPLINPEHYMISSSESLFSVSSCNDGGDTEDEQKMVASESKEEVSERVYDEPDGGQVKENRDVHRGAPDGSSLVGILPDGQREFSLERGLINEEDLTQKDSSEDVCHGNASNGLPVEKNLQNKLNSEPTVKQLLYVAMYPFNPTEPNQLSLSRNDVVYSLGHEENGWMKGEKKSTGDTGWFPISYVREAKSPLVGDILSEESEALYSEGEFEDDDNMTGLEYRAIYPYKAQQEGDLTLREGDIIIVTESHDNGWWRGCLGEQEGWFPGTYVEPVPQTPATSGFYEDVLSPLRMVYPLSTSSPVDNGNQDNTLTVKAENLSAAEEKNVTQVLNEKVTRSNVQVTAAESSDESVSPINKKFKPHVPRRFVKPKLVILPKQRKNSMKALKKPSRPPPPVPKESNDSYNTEEAPTSEQNSGDVNAVVLGRLESNQMHINDHRRKTLPRPKEPPPPAPDVLTGSSKDSTVPVVASKVETSSFCDHDRLQTFSQSMDDGDYEDVEPGLQLACSNTGGKMLDSGLGFDSSIPGVHTSARLEQSEKVKVALSNSPESVIDMSPLEPDVDKSSTTTRKENGVPPKSFSAILDIFERIVQKDDTSVDNFSEVLSSKYSPGLMTKPALPPKPAGSKVDFRRSKSEPDLLHLTTASKSQVSDVDSEPGHGDAEGISSSSSSSMLDKINPVVSKPSLPPRPKMPPQRSQSMASLVLVKGAEEFVVESEIMPMESVKEEANIRSVVCDKPEKPPFPAAALKGNTGKKQGDAIAKPSVRGHGVTSADLKKDAATGTVNISDSARNSTDHRTIGSAQQKAKLNLNDAQAKSEKVPRPPRPPQPPIKSYPDLISKVAGSERGKLNMTSESKTPSRMINRITSTEISTRTNTLTESSPVTLLNTDQCANKNGNSPGGDALQRQKILSNGSLKISSSPETGVKHQSSVSSTRINEASIQGLSVPSLAKGNLYVGQRDSSRYSSDSPSQLQTPPPPLPSSEPPDVISLEVTGSGLGNEVSESSGNVGSDKMQNLREKMGSAVKSDAAAVNIRTSPLRFFTPVGFSKPTVSSTTSPSPGGTSQLTSAKTSGQITGNLVQRSEPAQKSPVSSSSSGSVGMKKTSPLQFYTPAGFIPQQRQTSSDSANQEQSVISSSEQNLSTQPSDEGPEKFGSTGSLDYTSSETYQPYSSVEIRPVMKRTLTPPRPFMPSRWSAYHGLQKGKVSLAMVDIEIDDKSSGSMTPRATNNSSLLMISQTDLESDV